MGNYLSSPISTKQSSNGEISTTRYGVSSMQGWRLTMEDSHIACLDAFPIDYPGTLLFGVFDGHGGSHVAHFVANHIIEEISKSHAYAEGKLDEALQAAFLSIDSLLFKEEYQQELEIYSRLAYVVHSKSHSLDSRPGSGPSIKPSTRTEAGPLNGDGDDCMDLPQYVMIGGEATVAETDNVCMAATIKEAEVDEAFEAGSENGNSLDERPDSADDQKAASPDESERQKPTKLPSTGSTEDVAVLPVLGEEQSSLTPAHSGRGDDSSHSGSIKKRLMHRRTSHGGSADGNGESSSHSRKNRIFGGGPSDWSVGSVSRKERKAEKKVLKEREKAAQISNASDSTKASAEASKTEKRHTLSRIRKPKHDSHRTSVTGGGADAATTESSASTGQQAHSGSAWRKTSPVVSRGATPATPAGGGQYPSEGVDGTAGNGLMGSIKSAVMSALSFGKQSIWNSLARGHQNTPSFANLAGCTSIVVLVSNGRLIVANAGDSRCVLCRGTLALELSTDHKPQLPLERNRIYCAGGYLEMGRVNGNLNLSRAIGDLVYKQDPSLPPEKQIVTSFPDIKTIRVEDEDEFLVIGCDGIWENMDSSQYIIDFARSRIGTAKKLSDILEEMFEVLLSENPVFQEHGCDNMTAVIVDLKPERRTGKSLISELDQSLSSTEQGLICKHGAAYLYDDEYSQRSDCVGIRQIEDNRKSKSSAFASGLSRDSSCASDESSKTFVPHPTQQSVPPAQKGARKEKVIPPRIHPPSESSTHDADVRSCMTTPSKTVDCALVNNPSITLRATVECKTHCTPGSISQLSSVTSFDENQVISGTNTPNPADSSTPYTPYTAELKNKFDSLIVTRNTLNGCEKNNVTRKPRGANRSEKVATGKLSEGSVDMPVSAVTTTKLPGNDLNVAEFKKCEEPGATSVNKNEDSKCAPTPSHPE